MKPNDEIDVLECRVRGLENENRQLRQTLVDLYAPAILGGLFARGWEPNHMAIEEGFRLTAIAIAERNK